MKKQTYHITFVRDRESMIYELPLCYTAVVRAATESEAHEAAKEKLCSDKLDGTEYLIDFYRIIPVRKNRAEVRRFIDTVPSDRIDYVHAAVPGNVFRYNRRVTVSPLTAGTLRKLLSGKEGKVTRFRSGGRNGLSVEEAQVDKNTGAVTYVTHDLIVRKGGDEE